MPKPDVLLVTAANMPKPDPETHLLIAALGELDISAHAAPWESATTDWAAAKLVLIRTPWNYTAHADAFLEWVRKVDAVGRLQNPAAVVAWNAHKQYLIELGRKGIHVLPTIIIPQGTAKFDWSLIPAGELVIKPAIGGGARGTMKAHRDDATLHAHATELLKVHDVLVQPFAPCVSTQGEVSLIYFNGHYSHAVRKVPREGEYRIHAYYGGSVLDHTPTVSEFGMAERALAAVPASCLYARVDLVEYEGQPAVMELEVIEPELFLGRAPDISGRFAAAIKALL